MKKIIIPILALIVLGCERTVLPGSQEDKMVKVSLALAGEVTTEDSPLEQTTRSGETHSNDLIGIQVYQDGSKYAYGVFDDISNAIIYLHSGKKYSFKCALIKNGKDTGVYTSSGTCGIPFGNSAGFTPGNYTHTPVSNQFKYSTSSYLFALSYSDEYSLKQKSIERYYGELNDYIPEKDSQIYIDLLRVVMGISYNISGITDGSVSITITGDVRTIFNDSGLSATFTSNEEFVQCKDIYTSWKNHDDYTENIKVTINWLRGVGVNQDLGSHVVQVKSNKKNMINVSLSTSTRSSEISNVDEPKVTIHVTYE